MPNEIEIKVLGIEKKSFEAKLKRLGAKKIFAGMIICRHFDYPNHSLRSHGKLIRVRTCGPDVTEFAYKGPKKIINNCKIREEIQTTVADGEQIAKILKNIGMKETFYCEKKRTSYSLKNIHIDIDEYPQKIVYAEIEAPDQKTIKNLLKKLGNYEISCETAEELFIRAWPRIKLNGLHF